MKVANVKVVAEGSTVKLLVTTGRNWELSFTRSACNNYHAELEAADIYNGLRNGRRDLQREVLDNLVTRDLPGARRGALRRAIDAVKHIYSL